MIKKRRWIIPVCLIVVIICAFFIYTGIYYHADGIALAALQSDENVQVEGTDYGWFFDGPSEDEVLVFYPGAKVEETAYAPMLHRLAGQGMDVCLVKMPFRLAFFGANKADKVPEMKNYTKRYIGGHSLGGAMAANYAADHSSEELEGVILFAAYPTKALDKDMKLVSIYGSLDGVLNMDKVEEGRQYAPNRYSEYVIDGGNHALFGNYGEQKGDGIAVITSEEQQKETVDCIMTLT